MDAKAITHFCESPLKAARSESRPANRQSAYLIVIRGGMPGTMLRIGSDETSLGRSSDNTFPLDDMTVSRRHATVQMDARGLVTLTDEGSTNGTFLNGRRLDAGRPVTSRKATASSSAAASCSSSSASTPPTSTSSRRCSSGPSATG